MADTVEKVLSQYQLIAISKITPSRHQARKDFDEDGIKALAVSIDSEGLQQPVTVRKIGEGYELISGERRLRATKLLGRDTVEAHVIEVPSEASAAAKGLLENLQRQNLNAIEEAEGFKELNQLDPAHWTQDQIGNVTGKRQDYISRSMALLGLPNAVIESMRQRILSREHGIELIRLNNAKEQKRLAVKVDKKGLTVKQLRDLIDRKLKAKGSALAMSASRPGDPFSGMWPSLIQNSDISGKGQWSATFKGGEWHFVVGFPPESAKEDLVNWFGRIGEMLGYKVDDTEKEIVRQSAGDFKLPANAEEQAALEAIASRGPGAIFSAICGKSSQMAYNMAGATWEGLGYPDPLTGCRAIIAELRKAAD